MYRGFFGLNRDPFDISPNPYFLVHTPCHNEALASVYYGVRWRKGFVVVTGEVGTGKTLIVRCLLDLLSLSHIAFAYVFNPTLSAAQFLEYLFEEFGLQYRDHSKAQLLRQLNQYLIARHQRGLTTTLVVDEAQHLSWDLLEEIRLLTNLETAQKKLLQIVLVGQAELVDKLESVELRQLKQRIALWCHLGPLGPEETALYIERRLVLAGAGTRAGAIFPEESRTSVYSYSRGIPRLINIICDNALLSAYAEQSSAVTAERIDQVASDLRLQFVAKPLSHDFTSNPQDRAGLPRPF